MLNHAPYNHCCEHAQVRKCKLNSGIWTSIRVRPLLCEDTPFHISDFKKAFDTVPRAVLWQVLEELGVCGRILDIIKSLYAHDSAAVRSSQGLSAIFRCLMGVKQGCPLSPTLFGLYVDVVEKHLLETADIDAPTLRGVLVPLLLYADDLILMSTTAAGLQTQLNALASFCDQRQLTVNLSKTKVVVFEPRRSDVADFVLNGAVVERGESYKYLGFVFHATKNMSVGTSFLVAAARKAMFAMRRCAEVGIRDPALQCKLFDTLVLPILSYGVEVWGVKSSLGEAAEVLHRSFLKSLLGIRKSTSNEVVLAELGRYPLQIHFWQQILKYHQRTFGLDDTRLVSLAMMDGLTFSAGTAGVDKGAEWHEQLNSFLIKHNLSVFHKLHVEAIIDRAKLQHVEQFSSNSTSSSIIVYRTLQPEYRYAEYLSSVRCFPNRRLLSRFRCGCHGLHVDTGRWVDTKREDRLCQVCHSSRDVEDEQHFLFSCPAYSDVRQKHASLFQQAFTVSDFFHNSEPNACGGFLRECFSLRKSIVST